MKRVLTGLVGALLVLLAIFGLPSAGFLLFCGLVFFLAVREYLRLARHWVPEAPLWPLYISVPALTLGLSGAVNLPFLPEMAAGQLTWLGAVALSVGVGLVLLWSRTPVAQVFTASGTLVFGTFYFAVPLASLGDLHAMDPWILLLGLAIIWLGDAAALYVGRAFGRRKLAPVVSPNKTWEGAWASFLTALAVTLAWSLWHRGRVEPGLLLAGGLTSCAGQMGDLFESMLKRGAGVKDSGTLLPGHGGVLDRIDALLFGAPILLLSLLLLG
jgi:phosphatidate cytidylyltransferase